MGAAAWACAAFAASAAVSAAQPIATTQPVPVIDDDIVFREALRQRGLDEWLEIHLADHPPADEAEARIRRRERLLTEARRVGNAGFQAADGGQDARITDGGQDASIAMKEASTILVELIAKCPSHPSRLRWQFELARDYLERLNSGAFERLLVYEIAGPDAAVVKDLSSRAVEVLTGLRGQIAETWRWLETRDEAALADLRDSGSLRMLELLDAQSAALLTGAKLYRALAGDVNAGQPTAAFAEVLAELTGSGRLELPPGREAEQAGAVLMAAVAERRLGLHDPAVSHARQVIASLGRIGDKSVRQRLRHTALVAVLEQIRAVRDAGRYEAALQAVEQAHQWAIQSRLDDPHALVAVSLLEASVLYGMETAGPAHAGDSVTSAGPLEWLARKACLGALERTSQQSPAHRNLLYEVLAPLAGAELGASASAFAVQLVSGAVIRQAREGAMASSRLQAVVGSLRGLLAASRADMTPDVAGELRYLLGEALDLTEADLEAVQVLTDLAERAPHHDRAESAVRRAVYLAGLELQRSGPGGSPASRAAFVRAAGLFRARLPDDPAVAELTYVMAAALENDGRYEQAAEEYAAVPAGHTRGGEAALGRVRCWRRALEHSAASQPPELAGTASIADRAKAAVQAVREQFPALAAGGKAGGSGSHARPASAPAGCEGARLLLAVAEVLNHPAVGQEEEAAELTETFEGRFACPQLLGAALRQRILALRQLKRLSEARSVVERYLAADPEHAGTVMAGLLQRMHEEILGSLDRDDSATARTVAAEAAQVGQSLLEWGAARPERLRPSDTMIIRCWHASALLWAGRSKEAAEAFDRVVRDGADVLSADSRTLADAKLGKADALVEVGRAAEALDLYTTMWQAAPEHSELWWHAFVGSLRCHARLGADPVSVLQSIRQQRSLAPDLGGARWRRELAAIEESLTGRAATQPP